MISIKLKIFIINLSLFFFLTNTALTHHASADKTIEKSFEHFTALDGVKLGLSVYGVLTSLSPLAQSCTMYRNGNCRDVSIWSYLFDATQNMSAMALILLTPTTALNTGFLMAGPTIALTSDLLVTSQIIYYRYLKGCCCRGHRDDYSIINYEQSDIEEGGGN